MMMLAAAANGMDNTVGGIQSFVPGSGSSVGGAGSSSVQQAASGGAGDLAAVAAAVGLEPSRLAAKDLSHIIHLKRSDSYFMSDELRSELIRKNLISQAVASQDVVVRKR